MVPRGLGNANGNDVTFLRCANANHTTNDWTSSSMMHPLHMRLHRAIWSLFCRTITETSYEARSLRSAWAAGVLLKPLHIRNVLYHRSEASNDAKVLRLGPRTCILRHANRWGSRLPCSAPSRTLRITPCLEVRSPEPSIPCDSYLVDVGRGANNQVLADEWLDINL